MENYIHEDAKVLLNVLQVHLLHFTWSTAFFWRPKIKTLLLLLFKK